MSNANRDYAIVYDVKNSSLALSRPLVFYITDKNTSNIFVRLVTRISIRDGIDQYADIENASNYVLTMRVIKPNNEVKSIEATQHEAESIFQFDLTEDFKDIPGKYICELTISTIVNGRQELITSDPFNYEVKRSILSNVGEIIETVDTTVEKLLNDLNATKAELSSQINENTLQLEHVANRTNFINVKEFGAIGDGLTDDTEAIKLCVDYAQKYNKTVYIPDKYLITETINIDISKTKIVGEGGNSKIIISPNAYGFAGDSVIKLYNTETWEKRKDRMNTIGCFNIEDIETSKRINGIELGGIGDFEGHVETIELNEIFIIGCKSAQVINSHVYKIVTNRLYTRECGYGIEFPNSTVDVGEIPVWNYCFFCDDTKNFAIKGDAVFNNCSIHPVIQENKSSFTVNSSKIVFNSCHFEVISNNKMSFYGLPWLTTVGGENSISFNNCSATFTGTGDIKLKKSFIETRENWDVVSINGGKWNNFFKSFIFEDIGFIVNSLNGGALYTSKLRTNVAHNQGELPLTSNTPIYKDYTFENSINDDINKLFFKYNEKVSFNIVENVFSTSGSNCVEVTVNNTSDYSDLYTNIGVEFESDKLSNNTLIFKAHAKLINGDSLQMNSTCLKVFDRYGRELDNNYIESINNNINLYENYGTLLKNQYYMTYRNLPREAFKVRISFVLVGNPYSENKCLIDYFAFDLLNNS